MRDKPGYQDPQKHPNEGRRDRWTKAQLESDVKVCEDGMNKK